MAGITKTSTSIRTHGWHLDISNEGAGTAQSLKTCLIIAGSPLDQIPNTPIFAISEGVVRDTFGNTSSAFNMYKHFRSFDSTTPVYILGLKSASGSKSATGYINVIGKALKDGIISLYIANHLVSIAVNKNETDEEIKENIVSAINADNDCLVVAKIDATHDNKILLTAKEKGLNGNNINVVLNKLGKLGGEEKPSGIVITLPDNNLLSDGLLNPQIADYVQTITNYKAFVVITAFTDTTNLNTLQELFDFNTGLWSDSKQIYGHAFGHINGNFAQVQTIGLSRNDPNMTLTAIDGAYDMPYNIAAEVGAIAAKEFAIDPARSLQTLSLPKIDVDVNKSWDDTARNTLLWSGISPLEINKSNGMVTIDRLITTYQKNNYGEPDNSYLDVTTMYTLMEIAYRYKNYYLTNFPRHKLGNDGGNYAPSQPIITPSQMKACDIQIAKDLEYDGLIENVDSFIEKLVVARNEIDRNRLDHIIVPDLMNQLRIISTLMYFKI